jgi:hypothetical protein
MSVGKRAASGALWSVASSVGARVVGLIGTLYMTRLLAPEVVGEVSAAMVLAQSANWMSNWGFNHYMIVRGPDSPAATYHCAMTNWAFAVVGLAIAALVGPWFAPVFNAPDLAAYLPGLVRVGVHPPRRRGPRQDPRPRDAVPRAGHRQRRRRADVHRHRADAWRARRRSAATRS